jgi:AcrR family transcriptional regulator
MAAHTTRQKNREARIRNMFIDAAKQHVAAGGLESLNVKTIAELAGYSPGTLYNYFNDFQDLLVQCGLSYLDDCARIVENVRKENISPIDRVIKPAMAYFAYFLDRPAIFRLLFLEDLGERVNSNLSSPETIPDIIRRARESVEECASAGIIAPEEIELVLGLVDNTIHGNLFFYMNKRLPLSPQELIIKTELELGYLFYK